MNLILAFFISNILGVIYDFSYKIIFPHNSTKHKVYLNNLGHTIIQVLLNTFANTIIGFRILKGFTYHRILLLIRPIIQIGIFMMVYEYLNYS